MQFNVVSCLRDDMCKVSFSCYNTQTKPNQFNKRNKSHAKDQTHKATNCGKVINPCHFWLTPHLKNCWFLKVDLNNCNVFIIGVISLDILGKYVSKWNSTGICALTCSHAGNKWGNWCLSCIIFKLDLTSKLSRLWQLCVIQASKSTHTKVTGITSSKRNWCYWSFIYHCATVSQTIRACWIRNIVKHQLKESNWFPGITNCNGWIRRREKPRNASITWIVVLESISPTFYKQLLSQFPCAKKIQT